MKRFVIALSAILGVLLLSAILFFGLMIDTGLFDPLPEQIVTNVVPEKRIVFQNQDCVVNCGKWFPVRRSFKHCSYLYW